MGEGEGGMIWENGIETCIISCKKQIASLGLMQDTGCLGLVHWDDPEKTLDFFVFHICGLLTVVVCTVTNGAEIVRLP